MPVDDAVNAILDALPAFLCHVYVKRCQEVAYQQEIEESSATKSVVQIHFAGYYTCVFQEEVQWTSVRPLESQATHGIYCMCVEGCETHNVVCSRCCTDTTVHDNKSTALAREVLLAAEIEGSTQRHDPHATMLHLSPCLQFRWLNSCHLPEREWAEVLHRGSERMAGWQSRHFEGTGAAFVR